ncbi:NUDIX domain-containing protein [Paenibacillus lycopersici]|uniref:NUDIX domain-containing protein n=1 Tax=Paenibacillus lycopersici TaxID=2704462 RepID=A0A6C0G5T4_9BACL|nr:NUDIX domain-containing protein [Paenibacillus lycopersici]QHT62550.1 NUDIX domain-containing protein [Paenibacillus lycopersici]
MKIITAGAYVNIDGYFLFQVGPTKSGTTLGVVRLGGHREDGETGWQCAMREVSEESSLAIKPVTPPVTYWYEASDDPDLVPGGWMEEDHAPILVAKRPDSQLITPVFLASADEAPVPAMETKGILILSPGNIRKINSRRMTLGQYLESGGKAVMKEELPPDLLLEPFPHLLLLELLIERHPEIVTLN